MRLLRSIFNLQTIYFKQTPLQIFYLYFIVALVLWAAFAFGQNSINLPSYAFVLVCGLVAYFLARTVIRTVLVNNYIRQYPEALHVRPPAEVAEASINLELEKIDQLKPIAIYSNARLYLSTFNFYRKTKHGEYLAKQAYYTVLEVQLKRVLPHILFDSKIAKSRQFKYLYLRAQRISVQGSFDAVFDTYVPQTYTIDSLSFVSPEVMEVLVEARAYDIEIINDKLLLYAPLLSKEDAESFAAKGREIAAQLNDNIDTYRDDRLTGNERKTNITFFARTLLRSPRKYLVLACLLLLAIITIVYWAVISDPELRSRIIFNEVSFLIYITFIANCWEAGKIIRNNNEALEHYRILYQTNRGKPIKNTIT